MNKTLRASKLNFLKDSVPTEVSVREILNTIADHPKKELIEVARSKGKASDDYDKIKQIIETWMPNGVFNGGGRDENFTTSSGFIYIDIDNVTDVEACKREVMNLDYAYAAWKSFGGKGIGALIRVDSITDKSTFKTAWDQILDETAFPIDRKTRTLSRRNIISYDPNILINESCTLFKPKPQSPIERTMKTKRTLAVYTIRQERGYYIANDRPDRIITQTSLPQEMFDGKPFIVFEEGKYYCDIYVHNRVIPEGRRRLALMSILAKLWYMNPMVEDELMAKFFISVNESYCRPPLEREELGEIFNLLNEKKNNGTLEVTLKTKYIWFNPKMPMDKTERARECQKIATRNRKKNTLKKILSGYWLLVEKGQPIQMVDLARESGVSERTLRRRKDKFMHMVNAQNEALTKEPYEIYDFTYYPDYSDHQTAA